MKICWDNLEGVRYIKKPGIFRLNRKTLHYHESCIKCGDPHLSGKNGVYCNLTCANRGRIKGIEGNDTGRFYCSPGCKQECPIFWKQKYSSDHPKNSKRTDLAIEVPPEFRQMVFARDNHTCQRCGSTKSLHCHHIIPKKLSPMEAVDLGNGITFCKSCHKWVHKNIKGCGYKELADCKNFYK